MGTQAFNAGVCSFKQDFLEHKIELAQHELGNQAQLGKFSSGMKSLCHSVLAKGVNQDKS